MNRGKKSQHLRKLAKSGATRRPHQSKGEKLVPRNAEWSDILETMGVKTSTVELRSLGKNDVERKKLQTLLVRLPNERDARLTLAKIHEIWEMLK